jgi:coenzyme F420-reducing hydrogenase delta subunit
VSHFIKPFELGAQVVLVAACEAAECPHEKGILFAQKRVESAKQLLSQAGLDSKLEWVTFPSGDFSSFHQVLSQRQQ